MLHLSVNNITLDLDPRSRVTLRGSNPAFEPDGIGRAWSHPFRLPATGRNLTALQHTIRLDSADRGQEIPATLHLNGLPTLSGILAVSEVTDGSIEVTFRNEPRQWLVEMDKFRLNEILGAFSIEQTITPVLNVLLTTDTITWSVTLNGETFTSSAATPADAVDELVLLINAEFPGIASGYSGGGLLLDASALNPFVVSLSPAPGFTIVEYFNVPGARLANFMQHMANEYATPAASHCWPVVFNPSFYADNSTFFSYLNYRRGAEVGENVPDDTAFWNYTWLPFVKVPYIMEQILARLGSSVAEFGGHFTDADFQRVTLWNNYALDDVAFAHFLGGGDQYLNQHVTGYDLNRHVPEMPARDFWNALMQFLNLYVVQDGTTIELKKAKDQLGMAALDWSSRLVSGFTLEKRRERGYTCHFANDKFDSFRDETQFGDFVGGLGEHRIEVARPMGQATPYDSNFPLVDWKMSTIQQRGSSEGPRQEKRGDYSLRFFFDNGKQDDADGNEYWMSGADGASTNFDYIGSLSLAWDGEVGLYYSFWQGWAELLADGQPVKFSVRLAAHEINDFLRWETPVVLIRHPLGQVKIIVREIEFQSSADDTHHETEVSGIIIP